MIMDICVTSQWQKSVGTLGAWYPAYNQSQPVQQTSSKTLSYARGKKNYAVWSRVYDYCILMYARWRFRNLTKSWHKERSFMSSIADIAMCPSYQRIIAMGDKVLPLILNKLKSEGDEPDHWFWALRVLTNANPVPKEDWGHTKKMAAAWLNWGRIHSYVL